MRSLSDTHLLTELTNRWMDEAFPRKILKIKSTDPPWMTYEVLCRIKDRKEESLKGRRSNEWKRQKKEEKKKFYDKTKELAKTRNDPALFYRAVTCLKDTEKKPFFNPADPRGIT